LFAQSDAGEITYRITPPEHIKEFIDTTGQAEGYKEWILKQYNDIQKAAPYLEYKLSFNSKEALFERPSSMASDSGMDLEIVAEASGAVGKNYSNTQENLNLHQFQSRNKNWIIKTDLDHLNWEISNETKEIQGYSCKKATTTSDFLNHFKKQTSVTAWFCPDLPFQYGPRGIAGLPGLILELEYNHYTFTTDKINIGKKKNKIARPTKGEVLSQDEYFEVLRKAAPPRPPRAED